MGKFFLLFNERCLYFSKSYIKKKLLVFVSVKFGLFGKFRFFFMNIL